MSSNALQKHDIYMKLTGFNEQELQAIAEYIDFMWHKKKIGGGKVLKLQGILKGYDIDFSALKKFRQETWKHLLGRSSPAFARTRGIRSAILRKRRASLNG